MMNNQWMEWGTCGWVACQVVKMLLAQSRPVILKIEDVWRCCWK
jgi:hypothetical protein